MRGILTYGAFEAFRRLVVQHRTNEIDLEYLSDDISEMTSDPELRKAIAIDLLAYVDNLENYSFSAIRTMTPEDREKMREVLLPMLELYLEDEYYIDELVVTVAQQHERDRIRAIQKEEIGRSQLSEHITREQRIKSEQFFNYYFCPACGEKLQGLFNLDDHIGLEHFLDYFQRYFCKTCESMWLTKHEH